MKIKFIQNYQQHQDGEEVELPAAQAKTLIFRGYAQALPPETSTATAVSAHAAEAVAPASPAKRPVKHEKVINQAVPLTGTSADS